MFHGMSEFDGQLAVRHDDETDHQALRAPHKARQINKEADMITM